VTDALLTIDRRDLARGGARARAYALLRDAVVSAELRPGRRLSENELAARLGVSRTPVREALLRLADDGLVESVPQVGTFVARISLSAVEDAQFVREALECAAVRLAAERAAPADIAELETILARQQTAAATGSFDSFYALDDAFHSTLCGVSGHSGAWAVSQRVNHHLNRVRRLSLPEPGYLPEMIDDHVRILAAVARHDACEAEDALRSHLGHTLSGLPGIRSRNPDYFEQEAEPA
jgi:DNA-binding GntR family transcriptional regulator